eukprot:5369589-Pleurochrysis_carterae.AAC.3
MHTQFRKYPSDSAKNRYKVPYPVTTWQLFNKRARIEDSRFRKACIWRVSIFLEAIFASGSSPQAMNQALAESKGRAPAKRRRWAPREAAAADADERSGGGAMRYAAGNEKHNCVGLRYKVSLLDGGRIRATVKTKVSTAFRYEKGVVLFAIVVDGKGSLRDGRRGCTTAKLRVSAAMRYEKGT